jgi:hypothetical protein
MPGVDRGKNGRGTLSHRIAHDPYNRIAAQPLETSEKSGDHNFTCHAREGGHPPVEQHGFLPALGLPSRRWGMTPLLPIKFF